MGVLNWIKGIKPAPADSKRRSEKALRTALLGVNRKTAPFHVHDGKPEGVDLVGEVYSYKFDTSEMKTPLIEAAHGAGWGWHAIAFDKL